MGHAKELPEIFKILLFRFSIFQARMGIGRSTMLLLVNLLKYQGTKMYIYTEREKEREMDR